MKSEGFVLARQSGHNMIWKGVKCKIQIVTSKTPSDLNWYKQVKRDIRRKKKELGIK